MKYVGNSQVTSFCELKCLNKKGKFPHHAIIQGAERYTQSDKEIKSDVFTNKQCGATNPTSGRKKWEWKKESFAFGG